MIVKIVVTLFLFSVFSPAVDFDKLKEDVFKYVDTLDHPYRDRSNTFSKNLVIADEAEKTEMIIYMADVAMVSQEKHVKILHAGDVRLMYTEIPSKVDLSSVSMSFDKAVELFSQQYAYDVIGFDSLLHHYIGKYILYTNSEVDKKRKRATLLSAKPILVQDSKDKTIFKPHQIFFEDIPDDMAVTPSLFWDIRTEAKTLGIKLEYLTKGVSWKSDYNVYIRDDKHFDLHSWITIRNNSGVFYRDANISLISGEVKQVEVTDSNETNLTHKVDFDRLKKKKVENAPKFRRYSIAHREDLENNETKQISSIKRKGIVYSSHLRNNESYNFTDFGERELRFSKMLSFANSKENHLGIPLPEGVMHFYRYDALKGKHFLGSTKLPRVNPKELVEVPTGTSEDISAREKVLRYKSGNAKVYIIYRITLTNHSKEKQTVLLNRYLPLTAKGVQQTDSCKTVCEKEKVSDFATSYHVELTAEETYDFEIRFKVDTEVKNKEVAQ